MCGIAGFAGDGDLRDIKRMVALLQHRGPDRTTTEIRSGVHLGHTRLEILDGPGGGQPMSTVDDQLTVVFNGEIYNHRSLREELESRGHRFASRGSDTEVLLHGYREWGENLPQRLNGMFAFVLLDRTRLQIFGARDRFGEKPFFYASGPNLFAFASELRALQGHYRVKDAVDPIGLQKFLAYGYVPGPRTIFRDAHKLPAGSSIMVDLRTYAVTMRRYWEYQLCPDRSLRNEDSLAEELRHLILQATSRRVESDVPLGVFLSGGLDSSTVAAAASQVLGPRSVHTFCIGFDRPSFDESPWAQKVADHLGVHHHERILASSLLERQMSDVLARMDEPIADASILPMQLLAEFAKEHITVALSGDGGDELFGGYDPLLALGPAQLARLLVPRRLRSALLRTLNQVPPSAGYMGVDFRLRRFLKGLEVPASAQAAAWMGPMSPEQIAAVTGTPVVIEELYGEAIRLWEATDGGPVERLLQFFTQLYLQEDILVKVDRATMMSSLESRAVLLDNDVVDFASRLPTRFKYGRGRRKILLKLAATPWLPKEVIYRRKKGFGVPHAEFDEMRSSVGRTSDRIQIQALAALEGMGIESLRRTLEPRTASSGNSAGQ